jgi:hypothetical protein
MLKQFRKFFNIDNLQQKLEEYSNLEKQLFEQLKKAKELGEQNQITLARFNSQLTTLENKFEKSTDSQEKEGFLYLKNRIKERYNNYFSNYLDEIFKLKNKIDIIKKSINSIIEKNPELLDFEKEEFIKSIIVLTEAFKKEQLPKGIVFEDIQKSIFDKIIEKGWDLDLIYKFNNF